MAAQAERRTALVTGASRGIGRGIAVSLGADGYAIGVNYRSNRAAATETAEMVIAAGGDAILLPADMADDPERLERWLQQVGES